MNFKGHVTGGAISSSIVFVSSYFLAISITEIAEPIVLAFICFFMSLFPDFDTASIPQRWFYRALLVLVIYLYSLSEYEMIALCAFIAPLPLLHKHRGWTHWKITPFVISIIIVLLYDQEKGLLEQDVVVTVMNYAMFVVAVVSGHYTHLLLDSKFFKNSSDHH